MLRAPDSSSAVQGLAEGYAFRLLQRILFQADRGIAASIYVYERLSGPKHFPSRYANQHINRLKSERYENYITSDRGESESLGYTHFILDTPFFINSI